MSAKKRQRTFNFSQVSVRKDHESDDSKILSSSCQKLSWQDDVDHNYSDPINQEVNLSPYDAPSYKDFEAKETVHPNDCCNLFLKGFRGIWKTQYTDDFKDREIILKSLLRELAIYLIFIIILCIISFGMTSSIMFYFTKSLKDLFTGPSPPSILTFDNVASMGDFFDYCDKVLVEGLYWERYYNDEEVPENQRGYIFFENKLLGLPRLRQVRVRNDSCLVHKFFRNDVLKCFSSYSSESESKDDFGLANGIIWKYKSESTLKGRVFSGQISTYRGGGYVSLLANNKNESKQILSNLKNFLWLDRGTRAVFIDFTVYNANINLFCVITLVFEFPATGGCVTSALYRPLKLLRYVTNMDYFVMGCEVIFVIFILYYLIEELLEIKKHKLAYFFDVWSTFDVLVLCIGIFCIVFNIYRTIIVNKLLEDLLVNQKQYANFDFLSDWQCRFNDFVAVGVFVAWIKIFKYIKFNKTMSQLQSTLARCAKDIAVFAVMFMIVFLAYAQLGNLLFGSKLNDYNTIIDCIYTLFRIILGDFTFSDLQKTNPILGPIYFVTFVFFVFFVLFNMFLAIINDSYAEVKSELANQEDEFQMVDYFKKGYNKLINKLSIKKVRIVDIQEALKSSDKKQDNLSFDEWRSELKLRGYADAEIEAVFNKYDMDRDFVLNLGERGKMMIDLEQQKKKINNEIKEVSKAKHQVIQSQLMLNDMDIHSDTENMIDKDNDNSEYSLRSESAQSSNKKLVTYNEYTILARRVDRIEHSVGTILSKVDCLLLKLEAMDKLKVKRRETMVQLLNIIENQNNNGSNADQISLENTRPQSAATSIKNGSINIQQ
ncbi:polycystin-2-like protein 1 isoform X2 [Hydra vulgaris]|uniref:Polycystin-2-like protein 1 isoform X2 n=1 Tax=Hydra vulgaris TaxID=6087 RepID=A0ABM4D6U2_HYDVU